MTAGVGSDSATQRERAAIREAAAHWAVLWNTQGVSGAEEGEFFDWLRRSPAHVKEYLCAEAAWLAMDGAVKADSSDVAAFLAESPGNVFEFPPAQAAQVSGPRLRAPLPGATLRRRWSGRSERRSRIAVAFAASVALALGVGLTFRLADWLGTRLYSTEVGELRRVVLADGSAMELNTASRVRVKFADAARDIYLDSGEAFFDVARDPARPFRVISDTTVIRAVGTQFNVRRRADGTVITVLEGRVAVAEPKGARVDTPHVLEVAAGREVVVEKGRGPGSNAAVQAAVDPGMAAAWRRRRLIFENDALADVVAEFNRYNRQNLVIEDPRLAAERISGVFDADKPQTLVRFLALQSGIEARVGGGSRLLLVRPEK